MRRASKLNMQEVNSKVNKYQNEHVQISHRHRYAIYYELKWRRREGELKYAQKLSLLELVKTLEIFSNEIMRDRLQKTKWTRGIIWSGHLSEYSFNVWNVFGWLHIHLEVGGEYINLDQKQSRGTNIVKSPNSCPSWKCGG